MRSQRIFPDTSDLTTLNTYTRCSRSIVDPCIIRRPRAKHLHCPSYLTSISSTTTSSQEIWTTWKEYSPTRKSFQANRQEGPSRIYLAPIALIIPVTRISLLQRLSSSKMREEEFIVARIAESPLTNLSQKSHSHPEIQIDSIRGWWCRRVWRPAPTVLNIKELALSQLGHMGLTQVDSPLKIWNSLKWRIRHLPRSLRTQKSSRKSVTSKMIQFHEMKASSFWRKSCTTPHSMRQRSRNHNSSYIWIHRARVFWYLGWMRWLCLLWSPVRFLTTDWARHTTISRCWEMKRCWESKTNFRSQAGEGNRIKKCRTRSNKKEITRLRRNSKLSTRRWW